MDVSHRAAGRLRRAHAAAPPDHEARHDHAEQRVHAATGWLAHRLAGILEYGLLGRLLRKGFDMDGAIAALRKAKELDPKNADYRGALAKLLTYGTDGTEYGPGAKLEESIAEYRAVATDIGEKESKQFDDDLIPVLAHAGRFAEMKDLAKTGQDTQLRETGRIIAVAATDGSAAALHELGAFDANTRRGYAQTIRSEERRVGKECRS